MSDENVPKEIDNTGPTLIDLPTELILHIIGMLNHSPYYKCLSICQRFNAIENEYIPEYKNMCTCRLHKYSPNFPRRELRIRLCMYAGQSQLDALIELIKRKPLTCQIRITGVRMNIENCRADLEKHVDHPYIASFLQNWKFKVEFSRRGLWSQSINLYASRENDFNTEFSIYLLYLTLGEDLNLIKQFCRILSGSCFSNVHIDSNEISFAFFKHNLRRYCHILDVRDFEKKVTVLKINHRSSIPLHHHLLKDFPNLKQLDLIINEQCLENVINRILELISLFKEANLKQLYYLKLFDKSSLEYCPELVNLWSDFLLVIPLQALQQLEIFHKKKKHLGQLPKFVQSYDYNFISSDLTYFKDLRVLIINHSNFGIKNINVIFPLRQLRICYLNIHIDSSNFDQINQFCQNLQNSNELEKVKIRFPKTFSILCDDILISLSKFQWNTEINLYFRYFENIPDQNSYQKLTIFKNFEQLNVIINETNRQEIEYHRKLCQILKKSIARFLPKSCIISIRPAAFPFF